ncbi:uncharacterized protein LOC130712376 [Lotus japonicus]|uniref:uncharacterized protein LOC130712376 n=1 Tax=Lotus japonicus TaxID=34305 RepID=UPI00258A72D3|nr:uncharacterized protein LOC130712376 [Lotus japonicus]
MANTNYSSHASFVVSIDYYARAIEKYCTLVILTPRKIGDNNQTKVRVTYEGVNPSSKPTVNRTKNDIVFGHQINEHYDGKIRSGPHIKNGPYTCRKCEKQFVTSQHFASHARADHYKYESKDQRRKRTLSKFRRRNFSLQKVSGGLTVVPIPFEGAGTSRVSSEEDPTHGMEALGDGLAGEKIKLEPSA